MQCYKIKSVIFFSTLWGITIFSSGSSCFHISKETQPNFPEKTMKEISEQNKKDLEDSAKIARGELTGYEPGISTSARIGGLQAKRLIKSGQDMIKKEINEQNVSSGWVKPKDIKKIDTEKNLPNNKQKELSEEVKKAIQRIENDACELRDLPIFAELVGSPIYVLDHKTGALVDSVTISFKSKKLLTGLPIYLTYNASNGHICGPNYCGR